MIILLYNTSSDKRRLYKGGLDNAVKQYNNVHLKENTSLVNPTFILSRVSIVSGVIQQFNYLYCPNFKRYYFVKDVKYGIGGMLEIECRVDVLTSFKDDIIEHEAYIERAEIQFYNSKQQQNEKNGIFFDTEYPIRTDSYIWTEEALEFGTVTNLKSYYLTVNGGVMS